MIPIGAAQFKLLERLCNASAVSGDEGEVRKIVMDEVKPYADEIKVDALGNVLVTRAGTGKNRRRVLVDAHMDEAGLMIVADEDDGIYHFDTVGGIDVRTLAGKQVLVGRDHVRGVIGVKPIHLLKSEEITRQVGLDSMRIDLGPGGTAKVGDRATFATRFRRVGPSILAKAIDDRIGVAMLIELVRHAPRNIDLCAAFTVQEEIGLRGARVAAHAFDPDLAIAIDSTPAYDLPTHDGRENASYNSRLGEGPVFYIADSSALHDPRLIRFLRETAEKSAIPYQLRQPGGGGTDAGGIQRSRAGIPTVAVSVPHRYPHSPISLARVEDWKNTLNLLHAALLGITKDLILKAR
ncbi:MAG TPA: M20/M25/M40 family metallo-hydrolase [Anaerolineales bacterium]